MSYKTFAVRSNKIVTVSSKGTIYDGVMIIEDGIIKEIDTYKKLEEKLNNIPILEYKEKVITPSLIDCHTHLLEYAAGSIYPLTKETYLYGGKSLLLTALINGITTLGEQLCGSPICNISMQDYLNIANDTPVKIVYSINNITIGNEEFSHYSARSGNKMVSKEYILNKNLLSILAEKNQFPGENVFINATPANLPLSLVPRSGEIVFNKEELQSIVDIYHEKGSKIGAHVAGEKAIDLALECGIDVIHHGHGITERQVSKAYELTIPIVITPLGGTHLSPSLPKDVLYFAKSGLDISIATDAYLPGASYLQLDTEKLYGPDVLMHIANPILKLLYYNNYDENYCLSLLTANPAKILGLEAKIGKLAVGMEADFLVASGIPGLEITNAKDICSVFISGKQVISRLNI